MIRKKTSKRRLITMSLCGSMLTTNVLADEAPFPDVLFEDIHNIAFGAFNLKENTYLFSIPKDVPATERGQVWGIFFTFASRIGKYSQVEIFDCGPQTSHMRPYEIDFSKDDKYLVIESGGEGGSMVDVFRVDDLFEAMPHDWNGKGWIGTDQCIEPLATVGAYNVVVSFHGWDGHIPLVSSSAPLNRAKTSREVRELEKQGALHNSESRIYAWDVSADQFSLVKQP